jgi:LDH2 family malate/lactate/ureidoglycolate dehydrogenase
VRIAADHLKQAAVALVRSLGAGDEEARTVAENLVMADMRGIPTHGVNFLPMLVQRVREGQVAVPTVLKVLSDEGAVTHLDGGNGLGQTATVAGMRASIEKASRFGVGLCLIRRTNHIGLLAYYSLMAAAQGMIGFCMCNGAASMAPWGGAEAFFGSNPFSVASPAGGETPVVLDMSTSVVARGKIRRALRMKQPIPLGWALDAKGAPTEDPEAAMKGTLLPIGGPKGYGMALFVDLICGLLSGSSYARELRTFHKPEGPTGVGAATLAIDVSRFMAPDQFAALVSEHIRNIRGSPRAADTSRIYLPGEIEAERERLSAQRGVEVDDTVCQDLDALLEQKGLSLRLRHGEVPA